jgi:hypothetical protein
MKIELPSGFNQDIVYSMLLGDDCLTIVCSHSIVRVVVSDEELARILFAILSMPTIKKPTPGIGQAYTQTMLPLPLDTSTLVLFDGVVCVCVDITHAQLLKKQLFSDYLAL